MLEAACLLTKVNEYSFSAEVFYREIFDLKEDPGELRNLYERTGYEGLRSEFLLMYVWAELGKEPLPIPRFHHA